MLPFSLTWPKPAMFALGLLTPTALAGCGYTLERTSQIEARQQALAAAEEREHSLHQQISKLETERRKDKDALEAERYATQEALEAERRASDELAALQRRFRVTRGQLAALEHSRFATDAPAPASGDGTEAAQQRLAELEQRIADEEARRRSLQRDAEWTQQILSERQQSATGLERRLQALQAQVAAVETNLASRQHELAGLREQIERERAAPTPPAGSPQPEGGAAPR